MNGRVIYSTITNGLSRGPFGDCQVLWFKDKKKKDKKKDKKEKKKKDKKKDECCKSYKKDKQCRNCPLLKN